MIIKKMMRFIKKIIEKKMMVPNILVKTLLTKLPIFGIKQQKFEWLVELLVRLFNKITNNSLSYQKIQEIDNWYDVKNSRLDHLRIAKKSFRSTLALLEFNNVNFYSIKFRYQMERMPESWSLFEFLSQTKELLSAIKTVEFLKITELGSNEYDIGYEMFIGRLTEKKFPCKELHLVLGVNIMGIEKHFERKLERILIQEYVYVENLQITKLDNTGSIGLEEEKQMIYMGYTAGDWISGPENLGIVLLDSKHECVINHAISESLHLITTKFLTENQELWATYLVALYLELEGLKYNAGEIYKNLEGNWTPVVSLENLIDKNLLKIESRIKNTFRFHFVGINIVDLIWLKKINTEVLADIQEQTGKILINKKL